MFRREAFRGSFRIEEWKTTLACHARERSQKRPEVGQDTYIPATLNIQPDWFHSRRRPHPDTTWQPGVRGGGATLQHFLGTKSYTEACLGMPRQHFPGNARAFGARLGTNTKTWGANTGRDLCCMLPGHVDHSGKWRSHQAQARGEQPLFPLMLVLLVLCGA